MSEMNQAMKLIDDYSKTLDRAMTTIQKLKQEIEMLTEIVDLHKNIEHQYEDYILTLIDNWGEDVYLDFSSIKAEIADYRAHRVEGITKPTNETESEA